MSAPGGPLTSGSVSNSVYFPPISPYVLPVTPLDNLMKAYGVDLTWQKSHLCPCVMSGAVTGSPDPQCLTCKGIGWYWNEASAIFRGLITFIHMSPTPDEPGTMMDPKWGVIQQSEPTLTIPYTAAPDIWTQASINDVFTQVNAIDRYEVSLQVGGVTTVPYQQKLTIAPIGAVTIYNTETRTVETVTGYTVNGPTITLPAQYPDGTNFVVSYSAAKAFSAWRPAGTMGHDRPFGNLTLPKRFRLQALDLWLRSTGRM